MFANSLPLGSWHCCGCEKNSFRIKRPDSEVTTDVTSTDMSDVVPWDGADDPTQRFGMLFRRKSKTDILEPTPQPENAEADVGFEHVGNVTRSDDSLLVRKARAARYSIKFRDGVVDRILSGQSTIKQVRGELNLSERDLLDWVNDRVSRQDERIAKLSHVVETVKQLSQKSSATNLRIDLVESTPDDFDASPKFADRGITIDGEVIDQE